MRTWEARRWEKLQILQRIPAPKRGRACSFAALALAAGLIGCGGEPSKTVPVACKEGAGAVARGLRRAPGAVRVGGTLISDCFTRASDPGDVQALGLTYLPVAERLAADARSRPQGPAPLRLGFLVGAIHRGTADAQGIYAELERRIDLELAGIDRGSAEFRRGQRAGRDHG
jgi:hypothetical protein